MSLEKFKLKSLKDKLREQEEKERLDLVVDAVVEGKEVPKDKPKVKILKVANKLGKKK